MSNKNPLFHAPHLNASQAIDPQSIVALTSGDPSSIAPFITLKAWLELRHTKYNFFLIENHHYINDLIKLFKLDIKTHVINEVSEASSIFKDALPILSIPASQLGIINDLERTTKERTLYLGKRLVYNSKSLLYSLDKAIELALNHEVKAIVTNPLDKDLVNNFIEAKSGSIGNQLNSPKFLGHTEYLADKSWHVDPVMMMATPYNKLKVVPITTHVSLKNAITSLSIEHIIKVATKTSNFLQKHYHITNPKLVLTGLNPHSGENGLMGTEEQEIIIPAIKALNNLGINCQGPLPGDTVFTAYNINTYDVILGMYHDQVLGPFKALYFDEGVNVTIGLPFIRTSPDHGTAFDLIDLEHLAENEQLTFLDNNICEKSLIAAIKMAHLLSATTI
ncbi:4-hydroxythreonine-4-phosphate dehydrogenase [Candidatus Hepatincolaceae symbiont of Richtersius coronifer]